MIPCVVGSQLPPPPPTHITPSVADVSPRMRAFMFTVFGVMALIALLATAGSLESIVEKATGEGFKVFGS